jgi:hypothetical protein
MVCVFSFLYNNKESIEMGMYNVRQLNTYRVAMNKSMYECVYLAYELFYNFVKTYMKSRIQVYLRGWVICQVGVNEYELELVVANKLVRMLVVVNRGPSPILQIIDEGDNDVTSEFKPYLSYRFKYKTVMSNLNVIKSNGDELRILDGNELKIE